MLLGLRTAIYPVGDLAAARDWYTKVVGHAPYFDQPFYVGFEVGGFELGLIPDGKAGRDGPQPLWGVADAAAVKAARWLEWKIPLSQFSGVSATTVKKMYIGVGDRKSPKTGGAGSLVIDDIRVIKAE